MLDWSIRDRETEIKQGVKVTEIKAKLVGSICSLFSRVDTEI